jgi:hypothetical protein
MVSGREWCRGEPRRHLQRLPVIRHDQGTVGDDRPGFWRRQVIGVDVEASPDLMLGLEILRQLFLRNRFEPPSKFGGADHSSVTARRPQNREAQRTGQSCG